MTDDIVMVPMRRVPVGKRGARIGEAAATCRYSDAQVAEALALHAAGLSQRAVALRIGCSAASVAFWARGERHKPALDHKLVPVT